jgi:hypothetical protein
MERREIAERTARIAVLVAAHGAPLIVHQLMAEATTTATALNRGVIQIGTHTLLARELVERALAGLQPAESNLDDLHRQEASGDVLDRVGS